MRTINKIQGKVEVSKLQENDSCPCWYANLEDFNYRRRANWKVGVYGNGDEDSWTFKISHVGDVNDNEFWARATSQEFAIDIIQKLKIGLCELKEWVKSGCP